MSIEEKSERTSWEDYFMNIAKAVATRSTCPRKQVGSVIVRDKTIISTGYNGAIRGMPHCYESGCSMENGHCTASVHSEINAIGQAAKNGVLTEGADIYVTASPCWPCFKLLANAGIKRIFYFEFYRDDKFFEVAKQIGIEVRQVGQ